MTSDISQNTTNENLNKKVDVSTAMPSSDHAQLSTADLVFVCIVELYFSCVCSDEGCSIYSSRIVSFLIEICNCRILGYLTSQALNCIPAL